MNNNTQSTPLNQPEQEESIDIKRLFFLILRRWYWLIICFILGVAGAYLYSSYQDQIYEVNTSIIVPEDNKSFDLKNLFEQSFNGAGKVSINNEIELLKSYTLNDRVVKNLNWRTIYQQKDLFIWKGLYMREPFIVSESEEGLNAEGVWIYINPIDNNNFQILVKGEGRVNNQKIMNQRVFVELDTTAIYGIPFHSDFLNFTLYPSKIDLQSLVGNNYRFSFRNNNLTNFAYNKKVQIGLVDKNSEVIRLTSSGPEPWREIHYLNELVRVYLDLKYEQLTQTQKRSIDFIDSQLSGITDSMKISESSFTEFRSKNQIIDLGTQGEMVMEQLKEIEQQRSQYQMQYEYFRNLQSYLGKADRIKQIVTPSVVGIQDPSLNSLVLKLSELYSRREILSFSAHENNPTLQLLNKEIEQVNDQLRENLVNLIDNAQLSIKSLDRRYNSINQELNNLPGQEQALINIRRKYELTSEIYTFLMQRRAEIEIALASSVIDIQIVDPARIERITPTGTSLKIILLIGAFLGLAFPIAIIVLADMMNNKIHLQEEVEKMTKLSIIGNVLHSNSKSELVAVESPTAPITESYRTIRTNLQYKFTRPGQKVIGIHSISPSEGKTFSATNIACILAMNSKKTLIIGADLRRPRLHKIFDRSNKVGLSSYLVDQATYKDIIIKTNVDNLWLTPSGIIPPNPAELLEREQFTTFIEQAKNEFDYIIIDNAPISMVTDGLITSHISDLNIFILRYAVSRKDQIKYINEIAHKGIMQNPALVINDIKLDRFSYGYGYSYAYNYVYSKGYAYAAKEGEE